MTKDDIEKLFDSQFPNTDNVTREQVLSIIVSMLECKCRLCSIIRDTLKLKAIQ